MNQQKVDNKLNKNQRDGVTIAARYEENGIDSRESSGYFANRWVRYPERIKFAKCHIELTNNNVHGAPYALWRASLEARQFAAMEIYSILRKVIIQPITVE